MQNNISSIIVRLSPETHRLLKKTASDLGISLNKLCQKLLGQNETWSNQGCSEPLEPNLGATIGLAVKQILEHLKGDVIGIVLYGSVARGQERDNSDIDLLVVLDPKRKIDRDLYGINFQLGKREVSPSYVHLPEANETFRGLWLEVAMDGIVTFDRELIVSNYLIQARYAVASGKVKRKTTYGQSYWVQEEQNL